MNILLLILGRCKICLEATKSWASNPEWGRRYGEGQMS